MFVLFRRIPFSKRMCSNMSLCQPTSVSPFCSSLPHLAFNQSKPLLTGHVNHFKLSVASDFTWCAMMWREAKVGHTSNTHRTQHTHTQRQMKIKKKTQKHFLKQWDINSVGRVKFKKVSEMLLRKVGTVALWWDKERKQGKRRECKGVREEQNICVLLLLLLFFLTTTGSFNHDILKQNRLNEVLTLMAVIFDFEGFVR